MNRFRKYAGMAAFMLMAAASIQSGCGKKGKNGEPDPPPEVEPPEVPFKTDVRFFLTKPDQTALFREQQQSLLFMPGTNSYTTIDVDTAAAYQEIDGFGYTLTGGSASLINGLDESKKEALLRELFSTDSAAIGVSYLRVSIGASDLSASVFTYNELPSGQTDPEQTKFSVQKEKADLIPILKKIIAITPGIKILGSPWTAPTWMKSNGQYVGGKLKPEYYASYAKYLVKYIQAMKEEGITIDAITPQNEPLHGGNNPSMVMEAAEQADFIKNHLGPAFRAAGLNTKIIVYDHNADRPDYPLAILNDPDAKQYVDGSAFHLYGGSISALTQVHNAHPDRHVYFTEQWVGGPGNFGGDLQWHIENLVIGATRNWSRNVLEWNLAVDPAYDPHTPGGCSTCLGAITIGPGGTVSRNVAYYIIAHASKYVRPGSRRIASNHSGGLLTVAFKNPDGRKILIVLNKGNTSEIFNIRFAGKMVTTELGSGSVGTYLW